jgi:nucleoid-associated protein YgaU
LRASYSTGDRNERAAQSSVTVPLSERATLMARVASDAQRTVGVYGRLMQSKVAALEEATQRGDAAATASAIASLQRAASFVAERHAMINASLQWHRSTTLAALLSCTSCRSACTLSHAQRVSLAQLGGTRTSRYRGRCCYHTTYC